MRNKENKHLGIEIEPDLHAKLKFISKYEGRSINGEVIYLIRQAVRNFEKENGEIEEIWLKRPIGRFYFLFIIWLIKNFLFCRSCRDWHALSCVGEKKGRKDSPSGESIPLVVGNK